MSIVPRDIHILQFVGEYGLSDRVVIQSEFFPDDRTGRAAQRRLRLLTDQGYLSRTRVVLCDGFLKNHSVPALYFLSAKGADMVEGETGRRPRRPLNGRPQPFTLRHRLLAVRVRRTFDEAAKLNELPLIEWIMEQDTKANSRGSFRHSPADQFILWDVFSVAGEAVTFRPDASFHVRVPRPSGEGFKSLIGYVEVDRSTESHAQFASRLRGIGAFFGEPNAWERHWPRVQEPFVLLFVICPTARRIAGLAAVARSTDPTRRIRFTVFPLNARTIFTNPVWTDVNGAPYSVLKTR